MSEEEQPPEIINAKPVVFGLSLVPRKQIGTHLVFRGYNKATSLSANSSEPGFGEILIDSFIEISDPDSYEKVSLNFETPVILSQREYTDNLNNTDSSNQTNKNKDNNYPSGTYAYS